jgi:hypothetical protein
VSIVIEKLAGLRWLAREVQLGQHQAAYLNALLVDCALD